MNNSAEQAPMPNRKPRRWLRWIGWCLLAASVLVAVWAVSVEICMWRGAACLDKRQHQAALGWLSMAERISFERAELHFLLARCYRRLSEFDRVSVELARAHELGWETQQLEREQWLALAQTGQFDRVNPHWAELFEHPGSDGPEISKAFVTGALALFRIRDATQVLDAWQADYPDDAEPYFLRGRLAETMLESADAAKMYSRCLELDPRRDDARMGLARALMRLGQIEQAEEHLARLFRDAPDDAEANLLHAECLAKLGKSEQAAQRLNAILQEQPDHADALLELGNLLLAAGRSAEALKHLKHAAELKPENREIVYAYGNALQAEGQAEKAAVRFKFVDEATKPLIELKELMNRLLQDPENLDLRFEVAYVTWKYKSREEGEKWFQSLLKIAPNHEPTHAALAIHYRLAGDEEKASIHQRLAGSIDVEQFFKKDKPQGESANEPRSEDALEERAAKSQRDSP